MSDNLGDTATQMAVMANLRTRYANIEFIGICSDPQDVVRTHEIAAFHMSGDEWRVHEPTSIVTGAIKRRSPSPLLRWIPGALVELVGHVRQFWNILRFTGKIDVLVISGGGQLDDFWGGPWGRPFELLAWTAACRLRGRRVIVFATAVDNLTSRIGTAMCFAAMRLTHYTAYRDEYSVQAARAAGLRTPGHACPDAAFSLPLAPVDEVRPAAGAPVVLACPISERAWRHHSDASYKRYVDEFVEACARLVAGGNVVRISNSQLKMDGPIALAVADRLQQRFASDPALRGRVQITLSRKVDDFVALARQSDVVLASRLHGVILPLVAGTPVVGVAYMRKVSQVMADANLSEYCVALGDSSADGIATMVQAALANQAHLRKQIDALNQQFRTALDREYDAIMRASAMVPAR